MSKSAAGLSNERLAQLVENLNEGLRVAENGITVYVNRRLCEITGYTREELLGSPVEFIYDPSNWEIAKFQLQRRPEGESSSYEVCISCKDGSLLPVIVSAQPIFDEEGTFRGSCSLFTVIREQVETERELRKSEARFRDFAEVASDRFWEQDENLCFTFVSNPFSHAKEGKSDEELMQKVMGLTRWDYVRVDPDSDPHWEKHRDDLLQRKPFRNFRFERKELDGSRSHWRVSGRPIFDEEGKFVGYRGTATDETKELQAQEDALEAQLRLHNAIDSISEGFAYFDAEDRLVLCNKRYREIFPELADLLVPGMKFEEGLRAGIERGMTLPEGQSVEEFVNLRMNRHLNPDQGGFIVRLSGDRWVQIVERRTEDGGVVGVWTDITELKRREQQLAQAQKMEALGQLTGGIAHDFNNLLAVVLGNLELLQSQTSNDNRFTRYIERSIAGARRGAALTQRLLAFSRKHPLRAQSTDVNELLRGMTELLKGSLGEAISVDYELTEELWNAHVDPNQLETVILNLVVNARDAMPDGGTLVVRSANRRRVGSRRAQVVGDEQEDFVLISVTDSGSGMSAEIQERVFEPFFTTKEVSHGSGLGLSIVYGFVQQSNGHIDVESSQGKGTTVSLYLPRASSGEQQAALPEAIHLQPQGEGQLVFVVEDDADVRELVVAMLSGLGYQVREAEDAETALQVINSGVSLDLLFSDVVLPGAMNGPDLVAHLQKSTPDLKFLFMSGYFQHAEATAITLDPKTNLLHKPFSRSELAQRIEQILHAPVSQSAKLRLVQ